MQISQITKFIETRGGNGLFPKTKTNSVGSVSVNAVVGSVIPAGTVLFRPLDNRQYAVTEDTTVEASPQVVNVRAVEAGAAGNAEAGEILNFSVVLSGVDSKATVILIGSGADDETDKDFALRIHQTLQSIYHGGNDNDYVKWALQVEGVNQAWAYPCEQGVGSTVVRIMTPNGFPDGILLQKVADYIDTKRPPTYNNFFVVSPIERPIDLTISGLLPDTPEMRARFSLPLKTRLTPIATGRRSYDGAAKLGHFVGAGVERQSLGRADRKYSARYR